MDSVISFVSSVMPLFEKLEAVVNKGYQRKDLTEDNKLQLLRLKRRFKAALHLVPELQPCAGQNNITYTRLLEFQTTLTEDVDRLVAWAERIEKARSTDRVKRMKEILDMCEKDLDSFYNFLGDSISSGQENSCSEIYIPRNSVPVNPPRLTLDYENIDRCEGKLRAAILDNKGSRVVAIVATGKGGVGKTCALRGLADDEKINTRFPGGILYIQLGNNAAPGDILQALADIVANTGGRTISESLRTKKTLHEASKEASDWFRSQICLFLVDDIWRVNGIDSDVLDTLGSIANRKSRLVYTTRDKHFLGRAHKLIEFKENEVYSDLSIQMLMRHGGFEAWEKLDGKNETAFKAILKECQGLPLAFGIAGGTVFKYALRKDERNKHDAWSEFYDDLLSNEVDASFFTFTAQQYGGLTKIVDVSLQVLVSQNKQQVYKNLFRALCVLQKQQRVPLNMLQKLWDLGSLKETKIVAEEFDDVSILQLRRENGVVSIQLHDLILDIAKHQASSSDETQSFFRRLVLNYFRSWHDESGRIRQATKDDNVPHYLPKDRTGLEKSTRGSRLGLCNDAKILLPESIGMKNACWWSCEDDGYIHNNLCRILQNAGYTDELLWLLSQPHWIVTRLLNEGIYNVEKDLEIGISTLSKRTYFHVDHREHLEIIGKAARMSCTFATKNPREIWFQLYGRMLWHATQNIMTKDFIESIEKYAPRPWVKASIGFLQQASSVAEDVVSSNGGVECIRFEQKELWFVWNNYETMGVTRYNTATGSYKSVDFAAQDMVNSRGCLPRMYCAAFVSGGNSVVTAHYPGSVYVWNRDTGEKKRDWQAQRKTRFRKRKTKNDELRRRTPWFLRCFGIVREEQVQPFLAFSADGTLIASPCYHKNPVRFWKSLDGERVGHLLRGQENYNRSMAMNMDGSLVVTSSNKSVRLWDSRSGNILAEPPVTNRYSSITVALSNNGRYIAYGPDGGKLRIWDTQNGEIEKEKYLPFDRFAEHVQCLAVSDDGSLVVAGSLENKVYLWDVLLEEEDVKRFSGHTSAVRCVAVSPDGRQIASGSAGRTVRIWNPATDDNVIQPAQREISKVRCLTVSADGSRFVSGLDDGTVHVWDICTGKRVLNPFCEHTDRVSSVAMSTDGNVIVSASVDRSVLLWDAKNGEVLLRLFTEGLGMNCVVVSADGSVIVGSCYSGAVRVWDAHGKELRGPVDRFIFASRVGIDESCSRIVTIEPRLERAEKLWDLYSGRCLLTCDDESWESTLDSLTISWSSYVADKHFEDFEVKTLGADGSRTVLATSEVAMTNFGSSDVYWSATLDTCRIVR